MEAEAVARAPLLLRPRPGALYLRRGRPLGGDKLELDIEVGRDARR